MTTYTKHVDELERFFLEKMSVIKLYLIKENINHSELKFLVNTGKPWNGLKQPTFWKIALYIGTDNNIILDVGSNSRILECDPLGLR